MRQVSFVNCVHTFMEMGFRQFLETDFSDWTVVQLYHDQTVPVSEIARKTGKSIGEIYRILRCMNINPNRQITNHHNVKMLVDSGLCAKEIAGLTGYTDRNVRYIRNKCL